MISKKELNDYPEFRSIFHSMQYAPTVFGLFFFPHMFTTPFGSFHKDLIKSFMTSKKSITIAKIPRGFGKSTIISFLLAIWLIFVKGMKYIVLISKTQDMAEDMLNDIKVAVTHHRFVAIFGDVIGTKWNEKQAHIYCPEWGIDAIIGAKGLDTHLRGTKKGANRIDYAIIDDPESDDETENPRTLSKRVTWISKVLEPALTENETRGIGKNLVHNFYGKIWWLGTPIGEDCVVNRVAKYPDVKLVTYPALVTTDKMAKKLGVKKGCSIWEDKFTTEELMDKRQKLISRGEAEVWWSEFMVDPRGTTDITFRGSNNYFINADVTHIDIPMCLAIDLAYGESRKHDKASGAVGGFSSDRKLYQFGSIRFSKNPETFLNEIVEVLKYYDSIDRPINRIGVESLAFKMYKMNMRNKIFDELGIYPYIVELKHKSIPKINRIQRLIPFHQDGSFLIKRNMEILIEQMDRFPSFKGGIDDLDSSAYLLDLAIKPAKVIEKAIDTRGFIAKDIDRRYKEERAKDAISRRNRAFRTKRRGGLNRVI